MKLITTSKESQRGKVGIPILLWIGGVPLTAVLLIWFFFFRG